MEVPAYKKCFAEWFGIMVLTLFGRVGSALGKWGRLRYHAPRFGPRARARSRLVSREARSVALPAST